MNWSIADYGLTAEQLKVKYEKWGEHPEYLISHFYSQNPFKLDYWPWVLAQLQDEAEELDCDNPYN
jgi:hypothetical protein